MHWQSCRFIWTKVAKLEFGNFIKTIILIFFYTFNILPYSKTFHLKGTLILKLQKLSNKDIIDIKGSFLRNKSNARGEKESNGLKSMSSCKCARIPC